MNIQNRKSLRDFDSSFVSTIFLGVTDWLNQPGVHTTKERSEARRIISACRDPNFDTRHGKCRLSLGRTSVNFSGMPTGLATSSAAPLFDILRMVQSIALPPNLIVPALNTRFRWVVRFSTMIWLWDHCPKTPPDEIMGGANQESAPSQQRTRQVIAVN
jgi:hypothetical protein